MRLSLSLVLIMMMAACSNSANRQASCGIVSSYLEPALEQGFFRAIVTHIDGRPVISKPNYLLPVGSYEFTLAELIDDPRLKVSAAARAVKPLTVVVAADQRYHLAAKFNTNKIYFGDDPDFWQPEVRLQQEHLCEIPQP